MRIPSTHNRNDRPTEPISSQMLQEMGREPNPDELAERMGMPEDKMPVKVVEDRKKPISMETPIGDDEDSHLGDFMKNATHWHCPADVPTSESLKAATRDVVYRPDSP